MRSPLTTLCYVEQDDKYLMLHRVSKKNDVNKDKWIGIGGHFEEGESPEECLLREAYEETGLTLTSWKFRGIVTFVSEGWPIEYMCLYTADGFTGDLTDCNEGTLEWVPKSEVTKLKLWEGDKIFLKLMAEEVPFFSMKLMYQGDVLKYASLDGKEMELFDVCDENGNPTGAVTERSVAHTAGVMHRTAHVWVMREVSPGQWELLMQKRSAAKNSFPSCYDVSAAGHVMAGDDYLESAYRELEEELGIVADTAKAGEKSGIAEEEDTKAGEKAAAVDDGKAETAAYDLEYAGMFDSGDIVAEFDGKLFHDREISKVYVYRGPVEIEKLHLQEEEVESVCWMSYHEVLAAAQKLESSAGTAGAGWSEVSVTSAAGEMQKENSAEEPKSLQFCVNVRGLRVLGDYLGIPRENEAGGNDL